MLLAVCAPVCAFGQDSSDIALQEAEQAVRAAIGKNVLLQREIGDLKSANAALSASLVQANESADQFRDAYNEVQLQMEVLGIETIKKGSKGLSENYMKAVSDSRLLTDDRDRLADRIVGLSEAIIAYMKTATSSNTESRMAVEAALRETDQALGIGEAKPEPYTRKISEGGNVVSVPKGLGIFVINLGRKSGVDVGMPLAISRKDRSIGKGYVVSVRDNICGAVISQVATDGETIAVGDTINLDTQLEF
jgi:FtsZ-binding cell division protein ZapB